MAPSIHWEEKISRQIVSALMSYFSSMADAIKELVDNPIDYRWGQPLRIDLTFNKKKGLIVVESDGGRGMGAEELQTWLNWGEGETHDDSHIGQYHQGGKAACGFLGDHLRLFAKRAGSRDIFFIEDDGWSTRSTPKDFGYAAPIEPEQAPESIRKAALERGHVRIEISKLHQYRWNIETLRRQIASTYAQLIRNGSVEITLDGKLVEAEALPIDQKLGRVTLHAKLENGYSAHGWAGRLLRNELEADATVRSGLRLYSNGRLVREGEWFGYKWEGKGALNSLVGDLNLKGFKPNANKTDYVERSKRVWDELGEQIKEQLAPLIAQLRGAGEEHRVPRAEQKKAAEVHRELNVVLQKFAKMNAEPKEEKGKDVTVVEPLGRKPATEREEPEATTVEPERETKKQRRRRRQRHRTEPPEDAVGRLNRALQRAANRTLPPIKVEAWSPEVRAAYPKVEERILINSRFAGYRESGGSKAYIAETALLEFFRADPDCRSISDYLDRVNAVWRVWAESYEQLADI